MSVNGAGSGAPQTPLSSRTTSRPPPSWPLEPPAFFTAHRDQDQLHTLPVLTEHIQPASQQSSSTSTLGLFYCSRRLEACKASTF
ncbi:unnamed protein product [Gongylonema pulchrum]|uniref:Uncharacterized protein n=1 Tax=Gongylonema pulchrum TaxID=637853 RepID=A0A183EA58_9BILA|nr:unnamed protein product [Gongylonema pulchrum]